MNTKTDLLSLWHERMKGLPPSTLGSGRISSKTWGNTYGAFCEEFVVEVLGRLHDGYPGVVLDPMAGTGSVPLACMAYGIDCVSCDLNPAAALVNYIRTPRFCNSADKLAECCAVIRTQIGRIESDTTDWTDQLTVHDWFTPRQQHILSAVGEELSAATAFRRLQARVAEDYLSPDDVTLFAVCVLCIASRQFGHYSESSNRTWLKPGGVVVAQNIADCFSETAEVLIGDLRSLAARITQRSPSITSIWGDASRLPLPDSYIDLVITSPPYPNRMDYLRMAGPSLHVLHLTIGIDLQELETRMVGSNAVRGVTTHSFGDDTPATTTMVEMIRDDKAHGSQNYYAKYYANYFARLQAVLAESKRVLKPGGAILLIVQDAFRLRHRIDMGLMVSDLAKPIGLSCLSAGEHKVRFFGRIQKDTVRNSDRLTQTEHQIVLVHGE